MIERILDYSPAHQVADTFVGQTPTPRARKYDAHHHHLVSLIGRRTTRASAGSGLQRASFDDRLRVHCFVHLELAGCSPGRAKLPLSGRVAHHHASICRWREAPCCRVPLLLSSAHDDFCEVCAVCALLKSSGTSTIRRATLHYCSINLELLRFNGRAKLLLSHGVGQRCSSCSHAKMIYAPPLPGYLPSYRMKVNGAPLCRWSLDARSGFFA